jgi:hypothetical protein
VRTGRLERGRPSTGTRRGEAVSVGPSDETLLRIRDRDWIWIGQNTHIRTTKHDTRSLTSLGVSIGMGEGTMAAGTPRSVNVCMQCSTECSGNYDLGAALYTQKLDLLPLRCRWTFCQIPGGSREWSACPDLADALAHRRSAPSRTFPPLLALVSMSLTHSVSFVFDIFGIFHMFAVGSEIATRSSGNRVQTPGRSMLPTLRFVPGRLVRQPPPPHTHLDTGEKERTTSFSLPSCGSSYLASWPRTRID